MILKGNLHNDGGFLARYLAKADQDNEHATLVEMRGFGSSNIFDAMRDIQLEAEVTRAEKPIFHAQMRARAGERLTDQQWIEAADRAEKALGLSGQPRVIVFHEDRETGQRHAHFVWSRIDREEQRAIDPGLYKKKLMEVQRGIERDFGLNPTVKLDHARDLTAAAHRKEYEQSRRLGTDIKDLRETIRECWERTDCGKAFAAALAERNLSLAQGDRRDFVVIDAAGGLHALGKRILGVTAAEVRDRLSDLDRAQLPSVEQARAAIAQRAIVQPKPDHPRRYGAIEETHRQVQREQAKANAPAAEPRPLSKTVRAIHTAWVTTQSAEQLQHMLGANGIALAKVNAEEAQASQRRAADAKAIGNYVQAWREGEILAVDGRGIAYRLNERLTGTERAAIDARLAGIDRSRLMDVTPAKKAMREASRAAWKEQRRAEWEQSLPVNALERKILDAFQQAQREPQQFAASLEKAGIALVRVTADDIKAIEALRKEDELTSIAARASGEDYASRHFAHVREGELAAVTQRGDVRRLNQHHLAEINRQHTAQQVSLPSVTDARLGFEIDRIVSDAFWQALRDNNAARRTARTEGRAGERAFRNVFSAVRQVVQTAIKGTAATGERGFKAGRIVLASASKALEGLISAASSFFGDSAPKLTRQQIKDLLRAEGNEETVHMRGVAASVQANEDEHDERMHAQKTSQQEKDLRLSQTLGTPPTAEANLNRDEHEPERERQRGRGGRSL